jgi:hypothetical protein
MTELNGSVWSFASMASLMSGASDRAILSLHRRRAMLAGPSSD